MISVTAELTSGLEGVAQARLGDKTEVDWQNVGYNEVNTWNKFKILSSWQILSKCNSLFPELFNQLENHSSDQNGEIESGYI